MKSNEEILDEMHFIDKDGKRISNKDFQWNMIWINVKDRLPKEDEKVLVYGEDGVFRAYCDGNEKYPSWQCSPIGSYAGDGCVFGITHWMPLPEPPKE